MPLYNSPKFVSKERMPRTQFVEYASNNASIILQKLQFEFEKGVDSHVNGILSIFAAWKVILASLFALNLLIIDIRKRIITLITRYFEGSKYKDSVLFSQ
jgi:hypothetical protein